MSDDSFSNSLHRLNLAKLQNTSMKVHFRQRLYNSESRKTLSPGVKEWELQYTIYSTHCLRPVLDRLIDRYIHIKNHRYCLFNFTHSSFLSNDTHNATWPLRFQPKICALLVVANVVSSSRTHAEKRRRHRYAKLTLFSQPTLTQIISLEVIYQTSCSFHCGAKQRFYRIFFHHTYGTSSN